MTVEEYMKIALEEAYKAINMDEVPVGCVIVKDGKIISRAHNNRIQSHKPNGHAEIIAIEEAGKILGTWNLSGCDLYVTIEPCIMCAGTIIMSRINHVYFGSYDKRGGAFGSTLNLVNVEGFNHYPKLTGPLLEKECQKVIQEYFKAKRKENIKIKKVENEKDLQKALSVRREVFIEEQEVPENIEIDEYDDITRTDISHVIALKGERALGTLRILKYDKEYKVGRVAILKEVRGQHIGEKLMRYAEKQARNNGIDRIVIGAQLGAEKFYKKLGYRAYGEIFLDAGIEHIHMELVIKDSK